MTTCPTAAPKASKKKAQDRWMFAEILAQLTFHWGLNSYLFFDPQQHISRITAQRGFVMPLVENRVGYSIRPKLNYMLELNSVADGFKNSRLDEPAWSRHRQSQVMTHAIVQDCCVLN
jgi:hypothetical protein